MTQHGDWILFKSLFLDFPQGELPRCAGIGAQLERRKQKHAAASAFPLAVVQAVPILSTCLSVT